MLKPNAKNTDANRLQLELDAEEYPYFQEVERLSRSISFLAHECYVNYEFFHRMTPSPPYAKCGLKVTGYRQRCLYFGLYFKQLRRTIKVFIAEQIPVTELQNMKEFRHFLPISSAVYAWCMENIRKIKEANVTVEIRPPGPTSSAVIRLSGPPSRCQELWERHLRAVPAFANKLERAPRDPVTAITVARTFERKAMNKPIMGREVDEHGVPLDGEPLEESVSIEKPPEADKPLAGSAGEADVVPKTPSMAGGSAHGGDVQGTAVEQPATSDLPALERPDSERPAEHLSDRHASEHRRESRHSRNDKRYEPYSDNRRNDHHRYSDARPRYNGQCADKRPLDDTRPYTDDRPRYNGHCTDKRPLNDTQPYNDKSHDTQPYNDKSHDTRAYNDKSHDRYGYNNDRRPYGGDHPRHGKEAHHRANGEDRYDAANHYNNDKHHNNDRLRDNKRPYHDDPYNNYRHKDSKRDRRGDGGRTEKHYRYDARENTSYYEKKGYDDRESSRYNDRWQNQKERGESNNHNARADSGFGAVETFQLPPPPPPVPPPPILPVLPFVPQLMVCDPLCSDVPVPATLPLSACPPLPPPVPVNHDAAQMHAQTSSSSSLAHGRPGPTLASAAPGGGQPDAPNSKAPVEGRMLLGLIKADPTLLTKNPQFAQDFYKNYPALVPELLGVLAQAASAGGGTTSDASNSAR
eukprot:GEMP01018684.1.p1 GENE.GEMP01018684.1~~GEMP01018684.1.p1  ORF type:complete len:692 (+),score=155.80 GEMP01018684.1:52-2127(+)